ncbi:nucleotidyltransferase family protein [bacterium]|nr:nucleotidyltransferase family protein [bacterium]
MNEELFVTRSARLTLNDEDVVLIKKIAQDINDWSIVYRIASSHSVSPIIYYAVEKHSLGNVIPDNVKAHFKNDYYQTAIRNSQLLGFIENTAMTFNKKIVLLKGMDLALSLYPNIGLRSMCDVDIFINDESYEKLIDLMKNSDAVFQPIFKSNTHKKLLEKEEKNIYPIFYRHGRIEIHRYIPGFRKNLKDSAWLTATPVKGKTNLHRLKPEYMLLHLCVHVYRHAYMFSYLRMYCDINEYIRKYQTEINWNFVIEIINEYNLKEKVSWIFSYINTNFQTPFPQCVYANLDIYKNYIPLEKLLHGFKEYQFIKTTNSFLKEFDNNHEKVEYVFRSFFPNKKWLYDHYKCKGGNFYIDTLNYCKYFIEYSHSLTKRFLK